MTSALPYGYSVSDAYSIAHSAAWALPGVLPYAERHAIGRHAVIVALYEAADAPDRRLLWSVAYHAIDKARHRELSANGWSTVTHKPMKAYTAFWAGVRRPPDWLAEGVCERVALWQILQVLPPYQRHVLMVLADVEDYGAAAATLGITRSTLKTEVYHARRTFKRLWFYPDEPPRRYSGWATTGALKTWHAQRKAAAA